MIVDWDDAYNSASYIAEADLFPKVWAARAAEFCSARSAAGRAELGLAYGASERERLDLFHADGAAKGLAVFVHGGEWMRFDRSFWSHLAEGAIRRGWSVAVPSYALAPQARVRDIARQVARAIGFAADRVPGPIVLAGHCSGGQLAARMGCLDGPLAEAERRRVDRIVAISGLFDLRPLIKTRLNETLRLGEQEAAAESPALARPWPGLALTAWVGSDERPEFVRQSELIANIWTGLGAATKCVCAPQRHHYDVVSDLSDPESTLTGVLAP